jgi:hypothetical protein
MARLSKQSADSMYPPHQISVTVFKEIENLILKFSWKHIKNSSGIED